MAITINNTTTIIGPSSLIERTVQIQSEQEAIDGSLQRNRIGQKREVVMIWANLQPNDFLTLNNLFTTGSGIYYSNNGSKYGTLSFSGLPFVENEGQYTPGTSYLADYQVRIREM